MNYFLLLPNEITYIILSKLNLKDMKTLSKFLEIDNINYNFLLYIMSKNLYKDINYLIKFNENYDFIIKYDKQIISIMYEDLKSDNYVHLFNSNSLYNISISDMIYLNNITVEMIHLLKLFKYLPLVKDRIYLFPYSNYNASMLFEFSILLLSIKVENSKELQKIKDYISTGKMYQDINIDIEMDTYAEPLVMIPLLYIYINEKELGKIDGKINIKLSGVNLDENNYNMFQNYEMIPTDLDANKELIYLNYIRKMSFVLYDYMINYIDSRIDILF